MNPLAIAGLGSSLLGGLFGGGGGLDKKAIAQLQSILGPGALAGDTNQLFSLLQGSPFGQYALTQGNLRGNQAGQALRRVAALSGGATSSPFAALASAAQSTTQGLGRQEAMSNLFNMAFGQAAQNRSQLAGLAAGQQAQPNPLGGIFGGIGQTFGDYSILQRLNQGGLR